MNLSPRGLSKIGALVAAVGMLTLFSVWSFQSAFRKPVFTSEKGISASEANTDQPQSPTSSNQPSADG